MILSKSTPEGAECAFSHHIPAEYTGYFEFTNRSPRYFCSDHAHRIVKAMPKSAGFAQ